MPRRFVSNKDETARVFESPLLELFTHVHPVVPVLLYAPLVTFLLLKTVLSPVAAAALFLNGMVAWTLAEYVVHRFLFHLEPRSKFGRRLHFLFHGVHHDYPRDSRRLVMAPVVSIPLAVVFYSGFYLLLGARLLTPFFAGFVFGYLCYDMLHYATHHFPMKTRVGAWLKHYHLLHHYQDERYGYGVSSPLWDYVFGTHPRRREQPAQSQTTLEVAS